MEARAGPPSALHRFRAPTARHPACLDPSADGLAGQDPAPEGGTTIRVTTSRHRRVRSGERCAFPYVTGGEAVRSTTPRKPRRDAFAGNWGRARGCWAITRRRPRCPGPGRAPPRPGDGRAAAPTAAARIATAPPIPPGTRTNSGLPIQAIPNVIMETNRPIGPSSMIVKLCPRVIVRGFRIMNGGAVAAASGLAQAPIRRTNSRDHGTQGSACSSPVRSRCSRAAGADPRAGGSSSACRIMAIHATTRITSTSAMNAYRCSSPVTLERLLRAGGSGWPRRAPARCAAAGALPSRWTARGRRGRRSTRGRQAETGPAR